MVYFSKGELIIRNMEYKDAKAITNAEKEQGWVFVSVEKYLKRLEDNKMQKAVALVAEYSGKPVGYINI